MTPIIQDNVRRIDAAGGVVAIGTDASNGAATQRELELVAQGGVPPLHIITMATYNAARLLGKQATMGSIETGKIADAVLLSADPTRRYRRLQGHRAGDEGRRDRRREQTASGGRSPGATVFARLVT